jgi:hypothetical protein
MGSADDRDDGTALADAKRLVDRWKQAHGLPYLSPLILNDLVERIERAVLRARSRG